MLDGKSVAFSPRDATLPALSITCWRCVRFHGNFLTRQSEFNEILFVSFSFLTALRIFLDIFLSSFVPANHFRAKCVIHFENTTLKVISRLHNNSKF